MKADLSKRSIRLRNYKKKTRISTCGKVPTKFWNIMVSGWREFIHKIKKTRINRAQKKKKKDKKKIVTKKPKKNKAENNQ